MAHLRSYLEGTGLLSPGSETCCNLFPMELCRRDQIFWKYLAVTPLSGWYIPIEAEKVIHNSDYLNFDYLAVSKLKLWRAPPPPLCKYTLAKLLGGHVFFQVEG